MLSHIYELGFLQFHRAISLKKLSKQLFKKLLKTFFRFWKTCVVAYELDSLQFDCAISGGACVHSVQGELKGAITLGFMKNIVGRYFRWFRWFRCMSCFGSNGMVEVHIWAQSAVPRELIYALGREIHTSINWVQRKIRKFPYFCKIRKWHHQYLEFCIQCKCR